MKPRKKLLLFISPLILVLSFAATAQASTIALTPSSPGVIGGVCVGNEPACVYTAFGLLDNGSLVLYYKGDLGNADQGSFEAYYDTLFTSTPTDPSNATITWVGTAPNFITCPACYLVIKDGIGHTPPYYFYNLSTWNGMDTIELTGFWPNGGAISHVSIWGVAESQLQLVPEPASLILLGMGLVLVAGRLRRRLVA